MRQILPRIDLSGFLLLAVPSRDAQNMSTLLALENETRAIVGSYRHNFTLADEASDAEEPPAPLIIGAVVGGGAGFFLGAVVVAILLRRRGKRRQVAHIATGGAHRKRSSLLPVSASPPSSYVNVSSRATSRFSLYITSDTDASYAGRSTRTDALNPMHESSKATFIPQSELPRAEQLTEDICLASGFFGSVSMSQFSSSLGLHYLVIPCRPES